MPYTYDYPRPALTADILLLGIDREGKPHLLLIERKRPPFAGCWALPGGFMDEHESIKQAAARELQEETGLKNLALYQWRVYSAPGRDPRGRVVSVVFLGVCQMDEAKAVAHDDAAALQWWALDDLPPLAFDHRQIVTDAFDYLRKLSDSSLHHLHPALAACRRQWMPWLP
ncbi:NUDIX domain-containing protein [Thermonema rossianum]|uniref:NUDIX domain-containing protein n=1 Tax=Thermonema rossianum TaxID=55505 RepID=UPI0008FF9216|nr:NUDIX hydrolase [Thermonema rossianum]